MILISKYFKIHPHLFRHFRCKHLVNNYGYSTSALTKLIGWKQANMALTYTETNEEDIENKEMQRIDERKPKKKETQESEEKEQTEENK